MAYQAVKFRPKLAEVSHTIEQAKHLNSYDPVGFDPMVLGELDALVKAAMAIVEDYFGKLDDNFRVAKKVMAELDELVKRGTKLTPDDLKVIETMERTMLRCDKTMTAVNNEASVALTEFRNTDLTTTWGNLLSNPRKLEPWAAKKKAWIDEIQTKNGQTQRVHEYVKRVAELKKAALQLESKGRAAHGREDAEVNQFVGAVAQATQNLDRDLTNTETSLRIFDGVKPNQKEDPRTLAQLKSALTSAAERSKQIRGTLKTLNTKIEAFKKIATQFSDSTHRKAAQKAYDAAVRDYKLREARIKKLGVTEADCAKLLDKVSKLK